MNTRRNKIVTTILLIIVVFCFVYGALTQYVRAESIEEYKSQIEENNIQIQNMEDIKSQLHMTAELLRGSDYINGGLDVQLSQKWHECNSYQETKRSENSELQDEIKRLEDSKTFVGNFKITHYCPCYTCNGGWGNKTAVGTIMTPYKTIAVDPRVIPLGSTVEIQGQTYIAEDTGGAIKGNRIDLCVSSHSEAYRRGVLYNVPVYIIK